MKFVCELCKYETENKSWYDRHLLSNKHKKKLIIKCKYCENELINESVILYHYENECIQYHKHLLKKKERKNNKKFINYEDRIKNIIKEYEDKLKNVIDGYESKIDKLNVELDNLYRGHKEDMVAMCKEIIDKKEESYLSMIKDTNKELMDTTKNAMSLIASMNTDTHANMTYIQQAYFNAPDFLCNIKMTSEELVECITSQNSIEAISKIFIKTFPVTSCPTDRSFWVLDPSRIKFFTKYNGEWKVDNNGEHIKGIFIDELSKKMEPIFSNIFIAMQSIMTNNENGTEFQDEDEKEYKKLSELQGKIVSFAQTLKNMPSVGKAMKKISNVAAYRVNKN